MANEPGVENGILLDPQPYFWHIIGRRENSAANDFAEVLASLPARGMGVNPRAGERQQPGAPFHGITLMVGADGGPRGRIWLPTALPTTDHNGNEWFTREVQVITDAPGGVHGQDFVWSWRELGGHPYVPINRVPDVIHKYNDSDRDNNQCDTCGRDRHDPVHAIPESKDRHAYDGGQRDTGLCDICQQPNDHPLHADPRPDDVAARIAKVEVQLESLTGQCLANTRRLEEQAEAIEALQKSNGGEMDMNRFREALREALSSGLSVQAEVNLNGSGVLRHGHGISIVILYEGREIARK